MINRFKFRFWDTTDKRFIDDPRISGSGHVSYFTGTRLEFCDDVIPSQGTGYKDKNDKDIYENDRVKILSRTGDIYDLGEVKFGEYGDNEGYADYTHCGWYVDCKESFNPKYPDATLWDYKKTLPDLHKDIEVVGNTFENPELLK